MIARYTNVITLMILISILESCCWSTKNTPLGKGIKISEYSYRETQIMYCNDPCCNSGIPIIPQTVIGYNFNEKWIIAKTDSEYNHNPKFYTYWVFNKNNISENPKYDDFKVNLIGPLDSIAFNKFLIEKNIRLQLIDYP